MLVFLNLLFLGTCTIYLYILSSQVVSVGTFSGSFILFYFCIYFGLACDQGNQFLCLEEEGRKGAG